MNRPTNPPDWATGAGYTAGPYAGQPNKAYPPNGNIAEGFDPGAGVPMEWLNERLNNHGQWIKWIGSGSRAVYRELLMPTGAFVAAQAPIPNFGPLQIGIVGADSSCTFFDPGGIDNNYNGRCAQLWAGASGSRYASLFSSSRLIGLINPAFLSLHAEFDFALDASAMANSPVAYVGMTNGGGFVNAISDGIYLTYQNPLNGSHWHFHVASSRGGGASDVVLAAGFDPTSDVFQHFAIDFYGANSVEGLANGSAYTTLTVGGTLAATINLAANKVPTANCFFGAGMLSTSANAALGFIGNWDVEWNNY